MSTLRQWEYLVGVVDEGSFTAAAESLGVSQPGLSHQIATLERELGGRLLDRMPRSTRPTPLGRAVLPHARAALAENRRARDAAASVLGATAGAIEVVTITSLGLAVLPGIPEAWLSAHPGTSVQVREHQTVSAVVQSMAEGCGDVAISPMPQDWPGPHRLVGTEEFVVVVHAGHPLAEAGSLPLAALAGESWVQFAPEHGLAGVLERCAEEAGFTPRIAMRTPQTAAAPRFVEAGVGAALIPANVLERGFAGAVLRLDPSRDRQVHAFTRSDPDALTSAFIDTVIATADLTGQRASQLGRHAIESDDMTTVSAGRGPRSTTHNARRASGDR